ncbi:MAG: pseudaminic acid synthase [Acidimicrobiales bacterium]
MDGAPMAEVTGAVAPVRIGEHRVGPGCAPYVIAELSANHGGSIEAAERVIRLAAGTGAQAVKLQTYTPDSMTLDLAEPPFVVGEGTLWAGRTLHDLYEEAQTPWDWHPHLFAVAAEVGLACFSTPFDRAAVDFLEPFDPPAHKIASFELLDLDLIGYAASTGRPLIISTGMATVDEIDDAVAAARSGGDGGIVLLRCNSAYPASPAEMDLATIPEMVARWGVPVGLSDHSAGSTAAVVATALGACAFEKHLIGARTDGGPDAAFSAEPDELLAFVGDVRVAAEALGGVRFGPSPAEEASLAFRRSLYVVADVAPGEELTPANVRAIRPAGGLAPKHLPDVLGRRARHALRRGTPLALDDLA